MRALSFQEREGEDKARSNSRGKMYRLGILGKLFPSSIICFNSWKSLPLGKVGVWVQSGFGAFFRCDTWIQEPIPWEFHGPRVC